jgi:LEA14-like dessication related protein
MLNWLFKLVVVGGTCGSLVLGFALYNSGIRTVEQLQSKYNEVANVTTELLTDAKIVRPPTYDFDITSIKNKIALTSTLKVANLSSEQIIKVHQTGTRDTWIIGGLLKGNAYFNFRATFTGSVEYDTKDIAFTQEGKTIVATLGTPKIYLSDIKYAELETTGNLNDIVVAKQNMLDTLDTTAHNFNYSLYLANPNTKTLLTQTSNQANESLKAMVQGILRAARPDVEYTVVIRRSEVPIEFVTIQNGSNDSQTPLQDILKATPEGIINRLKSSNSSAKVVVQSINNKTLKPN